MVVLHYKKTDHNQFLYQTLTSIKLELLIKELVIMNNMRNHVDRLAVSLEDLASLGPQRPEELRGLQNLDQYVKTEQESAEISDLTVKKGLEKMPPRVGSQDVEDKTFHRTGWVLDKEQRDEMMEIAAEAKKAIHKNNVDMKKFLTLEILESHVELVKGVVMKNYPGYHGLGDWEPVRVLLETEGTQGLNVDPVEDLELATATLWWAGKELLPHKLLSDYVGKNEKTKIVRSKIKQIVKMQKKGGGAPAREPLVDEETHKGMLAYYHKKQEESKKLTEDEDDAYMNSPWADSKQLKNQLHGVSSVNWKFK